MPAKSCPACGTLNPSSSMGCDCGYQFTTSGGAEIRNDPHTTMWRSNLFPRLIVSLVIGLLIAFIRFAMRS